MRDEHFSFHYLFNFPLCSWRSGYPHVVATRRRAMAESEPLAEPVEQYPQPIVVQRQLLYPRPNRGNRRHSRAHLEIHL